MTTLFNGEENKYEQIDLSIHLPPPTTLNDQLQAALDQLNKPRLAADKQVQVLREVHRFVIINTAVRWQSIYLSSDLQKLFH